MKIIIRTSAEDQELRISCQPTENEEELYVVDCIGVLLDAVAGTVTAYLEDVPEDKKEAERVKYHDLCTRLFSHTIMEVFPEHMDFSLSDAAIVKAQDEILERATKEGKSIDEVLQEYNKEGEDYVALMRKGSTKKC